ncbi:MAG TPA: hypothetical protein VK151_04100 [Fluviicola sp.]|nr:hypothetical protein [Fluviicola sp.]
MELENRNEERKVVTAEVFLGLLKKEPNASNSINLNRVSITERITVSSHNLSNKTVRINFHNCIFNLLSISKIDRPLELNFLGCTISNLNVSKDSQIVENSIPIELTIKGDSDIHRLVVLKRASISAHFSDSVIGEIYSYSSTFTDFHCDNINFKNKLVFEDSKLNSVRFNECDFEKYFTIHKSSIITGKLLLDECLFKEQFFFDFSGKESSPELKISIQSCKTEDRLVFFGKGAIAKRLFVFKHKGELEIHDLNINFVEIQGAFESHASYRFSYCNFNHFNCIGINSIFQLSSIKSFGSKSEFSIRASNMNNASLFDTDLRSFDFVLIEKSDFTNMTTSRVIWFDNKKLKTNYESEEAVPHEKRELYRQLKYNQEKQGNKIQALEFQSLEMKYYSQELAPKHAIANVLLRNKFIAFFGQFILAFTSQNRFILWIGKSNNHGQSFLKPLVFLVVLGLIFNFLIIQSASPQSAMDLLFKKGNLQMLPSLLNPVHDISKLLHVEETSFLTGTLDLIWKVVETTLIFQTITAFRKHVRV